MSRRLARMLVVVALAALLMGSCFGPAATPPTATPPPAAASASATPRPAPIVTPRSTPSPSVAPTPIPQPSSGPPTQTPAPRSVTHTVLAGDTLSLIAARYDTTWQSLVYWNQDRYPTLEPEQSGYDPNRIEVGWQLIVWPGVSVAYDAPLLTPTPPLATLTPLPSSASTAVWNGGRSSTMVALTFDMGGRTDPAVAIMTWLRDHNVAATVFMTGRSVDTTTAAREVLSIIDARSDLFDFGNHSYGHPDMTALSAAQVADELRRAEAAIGAYVAQSPRPLFRPPYGAWDADVLAGAGSAGYRWTVMWDIDTIDWRPIADGGPTAAQIAHTVLSRAQGGSIVLMHLGGYETLAALPAIVNGLRDRGFTLVTLNALLGP